MPPFDLTEFLDPGHCAIVNMECQENLLGPNSAIPALAKAAADNDLLGTLARLYDAARAVGVRIYYCTDDRRPDGFGLSDNMPIRGKMVGGYENLGGHGAIMAPIAPQPADVVFPREQGVTGFFATGLDQYLRNTGVHTLIVTGISFNLAVLGTTIEAANRGYTVIVPTDGVAGAPQEYVDAAMRYTVRNIAYTTKAEVIIDRWSGAAEA
jgi:nicotinamidase-related amidase